MNDITVIKRNKKTEKFSPEKLIKSLQAACFSSRIADGVSLDIAQQITNSVEQWASNKADITSADIRAQASKLLEKQYPDTAYLYKNHRKTM